MASVHSPLAMRCGRSFRTAPSQAHVLPGSPDSTSGAATRGYHHRKHADQSPVYHRRIPPRAPCLPALAGSIRARALSGSPCVTPRFLADRACFSPGQKGEELLPRCRDRAAVYAGLWGSTLLTYRTHGVGAFTRLCTACHQFMHFHRLILYSSVHWPTRTELTLPRPVSERQLKVVLSQRRPHDKFPTCSWKRRTWGKCILALAAAGQYETLTESRFLDYIEIMAVGNPLSGAHCPAQRAGIDGLDIFFFQSFRKTAALPLSFLIENGVVVPALHAA